MASFKRTQQQPRKVDQSKKKKRKPRKRFLQVDVWQTQFGPVSERAVYDIFAQRFNVELHNMKKYSFPDCVNALRKLENPDYMAPTYASGAA